MALSRRLSLLRSLALNPQRVWDIGCDHGHLGLSFLTESTVEYIHLVDPSLPVINELHKKLKDSYITMRPFIFVQRKKGQELTLNTDCTNTLFIAGMGGSEIQEIMAHIMPQMGPMDQLIISPHRKIIELRAWLATTELGLAHEEVIYEDGQFYQVLSMVKNRNLPRISPFGIDLWSGEVGEAYRTAQLLIFGRHKDLASQEYVAYLRNLSN